MRLRPVPETDSKKASVLEDKMGLEIGGGGVIEAPWVMITPS
jgi:hypothetical protein